MLSALAWSCNNKENNTDTNKNEIVDKSTKLKLGSAITSPCELVSMEEVKRIFAVADYPIEMKDVVYTYPTCVFKWEDGKVTVSTSIGKQEIKSTMPSEVLIVMVENSNESMFKRATSVYKQPQEVSNLGTMAIWDMRMSQMTFLSDNYMFHVHVRVAKDDIENKEKAIEVSKLIIGKI